ncbi:hypothetical protein AOQ84DRAFT_104920 [Glonium stellatum]|uniref:Uncharacterized protein n=1 Tax=Glonium stellatum TaxID=574774 RepID=A0A8E2FAE7_9PEZI|nr:hypothetical protein AOQ84DRAFT_104920 [Glonium stellatum]
MRGTQSPHRTHAVCLLSVPLEIRREIYRYLLIQQNPIAVDLVYMFKQFFDRHGTSPGRDSRINILLASRQVCEEALDVLYGENVFQIHLYDWDLNAISQFACDNRQRIRRLRLLGHDLDLFYWKPATIESPIWPPILANLTRLHIVMQEPVRLIWLPGLFEEPYSFEQEAGEWLAWLKPILEYVNQHLSSRAVVEVDHGNKEETRPA